MSQRHFDPSKAAEAVLRASTTGHQRKTFLHEYTTNEDFSRMVPEHKRVVLLGPTGAGKSALANTLSGHRLEFSDEKGAYRWTVPEDILPFRTTVGCDSITRISSFSNSHWLGQTDKPFVIVDTPGHDDTDKGLIEEQAADLNMKLEAMQFVNLIMVTHKDYQSNRLDPTTLEILQKVSTIFKQAGKDVWKHVVIVYTRVDEEARSWRGGMEDKKTDLQEKLRKQTANFPAPCEVDVPVVTMSSYQSAPEDSHRLGRPVFDGSDKRPWSHADTLEKLWKLLNEAEPLSTGNLKVFDGLRSQLKKAITARDKWARIASARKNYAWTAIVLTAVFGFLCILRPGLLNYPGYEDEILYITLIGWYLGLQHVLDWFAVTWDDYVIPKLGPSIQEHFPSFDLGKYEWNNAEDLKRPALAGEKSNESKDEFPPPPDSDEK